MYCYDVETYARSENVKVGEHPTLSNFDPSI